MESLLKDHPMGHTNVVSEDWSSLVAGSITLIYRTYQNIWSFKTGGLSWQWSLKIGFTVLYLFLYGHWDECVHLSG